MPSLNHGISQLLEIDEEIGGRKFFVVEVMPAGKMAIIVMERGKKAIIVITYSVGKCDYSHR